MPQATTNTPLWKRMLLRRLKFLAWLGGLLVIVLGGSYLFAPQWLMQANLKREAMAARSQVSTPAIIPTTSPAWRCWTASA
jgi:hypothetical protein